MKLSFRTSAAVDTEATPACRMSGFDGFRERVTGGTSFGCFCCPPSSCHHRAPLLSSSPRACITFRAAAACARVSGPSHVVKMPLAPPSGCALEGKAQIMMDKRMTGDKLGCKPGGRRSTPIPLQGQTATRELQ
ncbi:hypothetical protein MRX96_025245 [Rhipicephalus microplus]